jgi:hypothetical protein
MSRLFTLRYLIIICLFFLNIAFYSENCYGQIFEVFVIGQQMKGDNTTALGKQLELSDNTVGGFGAGINVEKVNLNIDFIFGSTVIKMDNTKLDSKLFLFDANLDYSFFKYAVTPMVIAGIGSVTFSDSFVQVENLNEVDFSYNVGFGLRCAFANKYLLKGLYRATWTTIKETDNSIMFNGISVNLGYIF